MSEDYFVLCVLMIIAVSVCVIVFLFRFPDWDSKVFKTRPKKIQPLDRYDIMKQTKHKFKK